ncbi:MAG: hypothetical protein AABZ60_17810 [Planctomycetota bacterium]
MKQQKSFTIFEIIIFFIAILAAILLPILLKTKERANITKCKSNLRQLGIAMQLYVDARGKGSRYPPFNGAEFWTHMYRTEVMIDPEVYLCPSSGDNNGTGEALLGIPRPTDCSYGGRINALGHACRIFTGRNASDTPIGCDDDEWSPNHSSVVNILFLDTSCRDFAFSPIPDPLLGGARIGSGILTVCTN